MPKESVGQFLINHYIPKEYKIKAGSSSKDIHKNLVAWAKNSPETYSKSIPAIKRTADSITTYEGLSVGLDDLEPMEKERKPFLSKFMSKFDSAKTDQKKKDVVAEAIQEATNITMKKGRGSLVDMVNVGAKGKPAQLMKNIFSPISSREVDNTPYPYINTKSFSEGLSAGGYWVDSIEARNATIASKTATAIPGDLGKQMFNALNTMVVSTKDCGTDNGIAMKTTDYNILDRYLAKDISGVARKNTIITDKIIKVLRRKRVYDIIVRSPMTCEARNGVCQMCYGINVSGSLHDIGANVGTIAAQSLSEPLTQMALSTKHGVTLAGKVQEETGLAGVRKLLAKPKEFPSKATLAQLDGIVDKIAAAPQGGNYIYINGVEHYIPIRNQVLVKKNQRVVMGDALSNGLKDPREFTMLRGLGSGRNYFIWAMHNAYNPYDEKTKKHVGIPLDKRHLEVLAKKDFNHVLINNNNETFTKGDVVEYNQLKDYLRKNIREVPIRDSIGEYLGKEYLHYTVGTQITPNIMGTLLNKGIKKIVITDKKIEYTPYVTNIRQVPLFKKDFIARLSHHELKNSLMEAAQYGEKSETVTYDPVPAFVHGVTFGESADGKY
ncbi:MAG: hypothetical protein ACTSPI_00070 [Candidatus Heimdallarchaeaceae archaeon]